MAPNSGFTGPEIIPTGHRGTSMSRITDYQITKQKKKWFKDT
jgi:hypothetical protein